MWAQCVRMEECARTFWETFGVTVLPVGKAVSARSPCFLVTPHLVSTMVAVRILLKVVISAAVPKVVLSTLIF